MQSRLGTQSDSQSDTDDIRRSKAMIEIRTITPADYQAWNDYILARVGGSGYLTTAWKQAVERGYSRQTYYLGAFEDASLVGTLPLVLLAPPLTGKSLVSLPYCDYGGILARNEEIARILLQYAIDLAGQLKATMEIRSAIPTPILDESPVFSQTTNKCRMVLGLPESAAVLWDGFKSKLRSQIKRAMKNDLTQRIGGEEILDDFYRVFCRNMRDLGSPVHSQTWFRSVLEAFGDRAVVSVVYHEEIPVAAGIVLMHGDMATIPWASSLQQFNRLSPNMLLYWSLLEYAADAGFARFDFGRSTPDEGTYAFKKQWGAQPVPLHWFRQGMADAEKARVGIDVPLRSILEWSWKRLPVAVANAAGPPIRKHIAK